MQSSTIKKKKYNIFSRFDFLLLNYMYFEKKKIL